MKPILLSLFIPTLAVLSLTLIAKAEDKKAPDSTSAASTAPVQLFDGKTLNAWEIVDIGGSGQVEIEGDTLIINQGESLSGLVYKNTQNLPLTNYEITLEAKRLQGVDFFCGLTFPVGDLKTCGTLICGGWGGSVTGISSIDDIDASNNATGTYQKYEDDHWYRIKLRVTPENLSAWIDDKQVVDQDIKGRKVSLRPGPIESYAPLALSTFNTTAALRKIILTPLPKKKAE